ncbi:sulfurtransferase [Paenibacillus sp. SC116]|uniref:sulfurtransferase n=1 Tax=Paenibacillus sp. SC116 TaxID=2968986 RepID=UPI00215A8605|nr:sulfurtransferase [Paenibacillus sp. SC116]MCR8846591.1 sulfurtransferase [Paenibacillus sp. SC116]
MVSPRISEQSLYMEVSELHQQLNKQGQEQKQLHVIDCRFWLDQPTKGYESYLIGHIVNSVYMDLDHDLSSSRKEHGGRHPLPEPEQLAHTLTLHGISKQDTVVAYDEQGGAMASRLSWLLQWIGHEGDVYVLNGGYAAWQQAGFASEAGTAKPRSGLEQPYEPNVRLELVADIEEVRSKLGSSSVRLIDSREHARYIGEVEPIDPKAGHIPGALHRFWRDGLNEQGYVRTNSDEQDAWHKLVNGAEEIIVYCGSGVTACPNVLSLWRSGYRNVKLYAGSWSDWCSYEGDQSPVSTGEE